MGLYTGRTPNVEESDAESMSPDASAATSAAAMAFGSSISGQDSFPMYPRRALANGVLSLAHALISVYGDINTWARYAPAPG